jgi:hypothetical protein
MTALDSWLKQATRHLSADSAAQVRAEIREHYDSAREAALAIPGGATTDEDEADRLAVAALGDAKTANCEYRKVLLTAAEARMLRQGNWEARALCSRPWLRWLLLAMTAATVFAANEFFLRGAISLAATLMAGGIAIGLIFAAPFLPIYTPLRGRVFRCVRWAALLAIFGLAFGPNVLKWSWLLVSCLWPVFWVEWTRISIRRKLPVAEWPKQLYL